MEHAIEIKGLRKTYRKGGRKGKVEALKGIDLTVPTGTVFGLLGPNGAGKSTLVKALLSIVRPTAGDAKLLGQDFRKSESRRGVGYLPEGHKFPKYLTGRGVCRYFGQLGGHGGPVLDKDIDEKIKLVGMAEWADVKIGKYSKGMLQRIGLAQALIGSPKLVFLDEPTDGVDPLGRREVRDLIRHVASTGVTVFLNSHLLDEVEQIADRVAIMHHGQILREGKTADVIAGLTQTATPRVRFLTSQIHATLWQELSARVVGTDAQGGFVLQLNEHIEITGVIDQLRSHRVDIFAVEPQRANLEDAFVQIIQSQGGGAVGGTP